MRGYCRGDTKYLSFFCSSFTPNLQSGLAFHLVQLFLFVWFNQELYDAMFIEFLLTYITRRILEPEIASKIVHGLFRYYQMYHWNES